MRLFVFRRLFCNSCNNFPFRAFVTMIYWMSIKVLLNLVAPLNSAVPSSDSSKSMFFELPVLLPLILYFIHSKSAEISLNCISRVRFSSSFFCLERINIWFMASIPLVLHSFPLWFAQFQQKAPYIVLPARFRCLFFWFWVNRFCLFCVHLMLVHHSVPLSHTWLDFSCWPIQFSLVILSQISAACSESWY